MRSESTASSTRAAPMSLPPEIQRALRHFRRRVLRLRAGWRLGITVSATAGLLGAALACDRFFLLPVGARLAITSIATFATVTFAVWSLVGLARPLRWLELARGLEAEAPALAEGLLSSVEIAKADEVDRRGLSTELMEALFERTAAKLSAIDVSRALDARRSRLAVAAAAMSWGALIASAAIDREGSKMLVARFLHPASELPRPSSVVLDVFPGSIHVAKGDDVDVSARMLRGSSREATLLTRSEEGPWSEERRPLDGGAFTRRFTAVRRAIEYKFLAGDFASPVFRIDPRDPPSPAAFRVTYTYPAYAGRAPETAVRSSGDLVALAGTRADVEVTASEPLSNARIEMTDGGAPRPLAVSGGTASIEGIDVSASRGYRLFLEARDGVTNGGRSQYAIRALSDRPPSIEIVEPRTAEVAVEESSVLDLRYDARDDVGVKAVELVVKADPKGGTEQKVIALDAAASTTFRLDVASLALRAGAAATIFLRARDGLAQEALSAERTLRVALLLDPPEGPGWPRPLDEIDESLSAALEDWAKLLPAPGGESPETLAADPARAEVLLDASEKSLATMSFVRRAGEMSIEAGRAILVPSPNRAALENLGRMLGHIADDECAAFWGEAAAVAGAIRASASGTKEPVAAVRLFQTHRTAGSRIDGALAELRAIDRTEHLEDALERCLAIERDARLAAGNPERSRGLAREAISLAAQLTKLAGRSGATDDGLESIAGALLESAAPALESGTERALDAISSVRAKLAARYAKDETLAAESIERLEPRSSAEGSIEKLAAGASPAQALNIARSIILSLSEELESAESFEYADLDTSADLSAIRDLVERIAEEDLAAPPASDSTLVRPTRAEGLLSAYRATAPSRAVGRAAQQIDRIAGGEEDLAWKLRGARAWNWRTLRQLARTQREIGRALASARHRLASALGEPTTAHTSLRDGLAAALKTIDGAASAMDDASRAVASDPAGESPGEAAIALAAEAAGRAAASLDGVTESLEALRASAMPAASAARAWLRSQLGSIPERVARQAAAERAHAVRVKELSTTADAVDSSEHAATLLLAHEEARRETEALASKTRKEGDRLLAAGAGVDRLRAYDRAAVQLAAIAATDLTEASRALRATGSADSAARAGMLLEASVKEENAAEKLDAIARALSTLDADEALRISAKELEDALATRKPGDAPAGESQDPATIAKEARVCLDASLKAAETLAPRAARDPRKAPLLEMLRTAAERFRQAIELAEKNEAAPARAALAAGRARLEEAIALARKLRGESESDLASALGSLGGGAEDDAKAGEKKEVSRELEAAYAELEKLIEAEKLEREIASRMEELLKEEKPDSAKLEELEAKERDLEQGLGERHLSAAELVELVSKLVAIDRDGRDVAASERSLAADAEKASTGAAGRAPDFAPLAAGQAEAIGRARKVAKDFQTAGFKLSAVLPNVLRAWWKAGDAIEPLLSAMENASMAIESKSAPQRPLLDAAAKIDAFLAGVGDMRHQALEAIADQERGGSSPNAAQGSLERARRSFGEAARLRREGESEAAMRMRQSSLRSIADAAVSLRSRISELALPAGEEGFLTSRVLDEEATRLGLGWNVLTRGSTRVDAARLTEPGADEMPFPARFREWIRVYLRAIETKSGKK